MTTLKREWLPAGATTSGSNGLWALVLTGAVTLETAGARSRVLPGDAVLVDARTAHRLVVDAETELVRGDLWCTVPSAAPPSPLIVRGFSERQRGVVALVTACPLEVKCSRDLFSSSYAGLIGAAMSRLSQDDADGAAGSGGGADQGEQGAARADGGDRAGAAAADPVVAHVVAELAARPEEQWTLDEMAGLVHLSRSALTGRFRRATGHSPMRMLREVRMHRARTLLAVERLPVTRVAFEVGYGSVAAFSRAFAADHGVSPLAWRTGPPAPVGPTATGATATGPTSSLDPPEAWPVSRRRPWVPSVPPAPAARAGRTAASATQAVSGAGHPQDRPADPGRDSRSRADQQQRLDAVPVQ
ncbi:AraC family transcriptional regulator [Promicromonospora sp. NPDC050249]|uniref:AraC family transcriptional regulator n=1 Tax=Promicromonospora sp. NPDC050249 TaxID=3154743 RepID=UPI0033E0EA69